MPEPLRWKQKERIPLPRNERQYRARQHPILLLGLGTPDSGRKTMRRPEYAGVGRSAVAYVDGVYRMQLGKFSCGVVLFLDGKELNLAEEYSDPDLVSMRNVAGEIKGAELAMAYCLTQRYPESWPSITITRESQAGVRENGRRKNREPSITGIFTIWHRPKLGDPLLQSKGRHRRHLQRKSRSAGKTGIGLINSRENASHTPKNQV